MLLSEFDIVYVSQKAIKGSAIIDFLIDRAVKDYEPMKFDFSDGDLMVILQIDQEEPMKKKNWKCISMVHQMPLDMVLGQY